MHFNFFLALRNFYQLVFPAPVSFVPSVPLVSSFVLVTPIVPFVSRLFVPFVTTVQKVILAPTQNLPPTVLEANYTYCTYENFSPFPT